MNIFLAWLIVAFSAAKLATLTMSDSAAILELSIYIFVYVFVGLTPLAQTVTGIFPLDGRIYSDEAQTRQLLVLGMGVLALAAGMRLSRAAPRPPTDARQFNRFGTAILAAAGLVFSAQQIVANGIGTFFVSRSETARVLAGQSGTEPLYQAADQASIALQTGLAQFPIFIALFAILYSRRFGTWVSSPLSDMMWRCLIPPLILANVIINNPIGNSRLWGLLIIFAFASIYIDFRSRRNARYFLIASISVLVLAFPILDAFRFTDDDRVLTIDPQSAIVENGSYPVYQMALNGDQYVRTLGFTDGQQILGATLAFVPRSAWPDKAIATGQLVDPRFLRSASMWTEAYVDFGYVGVALLFLLIGLLVRGISSRWSTAPPGIFHALVPLMAIYGFFVLRGSLLPAIATLYQLAGFFIVVIVFGQRFGNRTVGKVVDRPGGRAPNLSRTTRSRPYVLTVTRSAPRRAPRVASAHGSSPALDGGVARVRLRR